MPAQLQKIGFSTPGEVERQARNLKRAWGQLVREYPPAGTDYGAFVSWLQDLINETPMLSMSFASGELDNWKKRYRELWEQARQQKPELTAPSPGPVASTTPPLVDWNKLAVTVAIVGAVAIFAAIYSRKD